MRTIWSGAISFGLVNIPVKLFPAVQDSALDLDMLDSRDHSNIKFKRVNANTGKEVPNDKIIKAYSINEKYVVLDDNDFKVADAKKTQTIEIINFVKESEISSIYYEQPYYLEPDKSGVKAYGLLRDALAAAGKVGIASFVMRNKETLAIIKPYENAMLLNRIRFQQEIRDMSELKLPPVVKTKAKEQDIALQLINQLTVKFDISKYKDTYREKLLKIIAQKAKTGKAPKMPKMEVVHKQDSDDLMSMLKASLGGAKKKAS